MTSKSTAALRERREKLIKQLPSLRNILRGSLIERYKRCGNPNCHCAQGRGHGPKYYLSVSFPGQRPQMDYIPADIHEQTSASLADFQRVREILEEICEINRELLRRRETL